MRHAGSIPHLMPRPVIQAAEGVVFASHVAGATRQLLAGKIGSGTVAWHLQVEGSSLAQVCHSRYHSERDAMYQWCIARER